MRNQGVQLFKENYLVDTGWLKGILFVTQNEALSVLIESIRGPVPPAVV